MALAPHFVWLVAHDFAPFTYAAYVHGGEGASVRKAVVYLIGSAGYVALAVLLALSAMRPSRAALLDTLWPATPQGRLVAVAFWVPLVLPALVAPLAGISLTSLWAMSAWTLLPVVLLLSPLISLHRRAMLTIMAMAILLPPAMVTMAPAIAIAIHRNEIYPAASHSRLLAEQVAIEWARATDKPLKMIGGEGDLASGAAFYLTGPVSSFPDSRPKMAPWVNQARLDRDGIALICRFADPNCLPRAREVGLAGPSIDVEIVRSHHGVAGRAGRYEIVIIPPRS